MGACAAEYGFVQQGVRCALPSATASGVSEGPALHLAPKLSSEATMWRWRGESLTSHRHVSDVSGRWLDVVFCGTCGTNLGFTLEAAPGLRTVPAGAFDDISWISDEQVSFVHVYARSRRNWGDLDSAVEVFEEHFRR